MVRYKCFILDDEPLALNVIRQHLSKFAEFEICGESTDPLQALVMIKQLQPDLIFLDIEMPELNGLDLIASIQHKPEIILTTAYREFAVEGFELNVLDYLVKPIPFKRFVKAIDKFLEHNRWLDSKAVSADSKCIFVRADRKMMKVDFDEILYIEGVKDYVKIKLSDRQIVTKVSVGNFLAKLPVDQFIQVHKSFVVARNKISAFTAHDVEIGDLEIPIGRTFKRDFLTAMEKNDH